MGDKYRVEVRLIVSAGSEEEAGMCVARAMLAAIIAAGGAITTPFAVGVAGKLDVEPDGGDQGDSPKAEDVFGRIMSAPDVQ